ncbi:TetR family transcriptional regulator C-terminal domain-containing protein [Persicitalea sp.]|uniref:TetR family transcriptional regulator C-terminal domain-containing protein n=1 Tax=Persicitalea sp. TaxID=3100273 RepID=UPI00359321BD
MEKDDKTEKIQKAYKEYVLEKGTPPPSVYIFAKKLKMPETEFYEYYNSFEAIESDAWIDYLRQTLLSLNADAAYDQYSVREKLLAFYYTWIEILKKDRSYVVYSYEKLRQPVTRYVGPLQPFRNGFYNFATELLMEGRESREVVTRPVISDRYVDGLWMQLLYILDFWVKDLSRGFESTDTAIEKSVNTSFDLMGKSVVDSVLDYAKFVYQNRKP